VNTVPADSSSHAASDVKGVHPEINFAAVARGMLSSGDALRFTATGYSMCPLIMDGDVVTLSARAKDRLRLGDVVAFMRKGAKTLIVHRIVGRQNDLYLTKGDNVTTCDGYTHRDDILGRVEYVERQGRRICLGLGPGRLLIAMLSRCRFPFRVLASIWKRFHGKLLRISPYVSGT
jgi:hypothetical protein